MKFFCLIAFYFSCFQAFSENQSGFKDQSPSKNLKLVENNKKSAPSKQLQSKQPQSKELIEISSAEGDNRNQKVIMKKEGTQLKEMSKVSSNEIQKQTQEGILQGEPVKLSSNQSQEEVNKTELMNLSPNKNTNKNLEIQKKASSQIHSFRPLLIQGGKKIKNNTKNIKVDINSISETEVFFIETDFKKRIYLDEGYL